MTRLSPEFNSILEKYNKQKIQTYKLLELIGSDYVFNTEGVKNLYEKILTCGTQLFFTKTNENGSAVYHLTGANFCRNRICPMCQFRRSEKLFVQTLRVVQMLEDNYRFLHLVLTIPNCDGGIELENGINKLYKGFSVFWKNPKIKKAFKGCLRCLEISYNYENDTFHPHLHCLIAVKPSYFNDSKTYLKYDTVREIWSKSVNSAVLLQINIRACKQGDYTGVAEVCKYCVKPIDFEKSDNEHQNIRFLLTIWNTLKGKRFLQKYGCIKEAFSCINNNSDDEYLDNIKAETNQIFLKWDDINFNFITEG